MAREDGKEGHGDTEHEDQPAEAEGPFQGPSGRSLGPGELGRARTSSAPRSRHRARLPLEQDRSEHRDNGQGHEERGNGEKAMDRARPRVSRPVMPGEDHGQEDDDRRQGRGRNGHPDLDAPSWPPRWGSLPSWRWRNMFSMTTMALSTSIPIPQGQPAQGQEVQGVAGK